MNVLNGIPVLFNPLSSGVCYIRGVGIVARDRETLQELLDFANRREDLGNECVEELLRIFRTWKGANPIAPAVPGLRRL
jgi:hypothetical protein